MAREPTSVDVSDDQKRYVRLILSTGCDLATAVKYIGCTLDAIRREMSRDQSFAADVIRAEAASELMHMRNVQNAARDEKHWRASVWWLERRAPERYGRRDADTVTPRNLESFMSRLSAAVMEEVRDANDLRRLLERLHEITDSYLESNRSPGDSSTGAMGGRQ